MWFLRYASRERTDRQTSWSQCFIYLKSTWQRAGSATKVRSTLATMSKQHCRSNRQLWFDNVAVLGNNVEAPFDFVKRTKFQRKTCSTFLPFLATKSNVASTLLLVWTGLYMSHRQQRHARNSNTHKIKRNLKTKYNDNKKEKQRSVFGMYTEVDINQGNSKRQ